MNKRKPKPVARWSYDYLNKKGREVSRPNNGYAFWNYLVKYDDGRFAFSEDGINPNEYHRQRYSNGTWVFEEGVIGKTTQEACQRDNSARANFNCLHSMW